MLSAKRSPLLASLGLVLLFVLLAVEARRYGAEESGAGELRRHRHRHRHEAPGPRWSSSTAGARKRLTDTNDDPENEYEDNYANEADYEEYAYDEDSDSLEDYSTLERQTGRVYNPKRNNNNHRRYDSRYPRYHHRPSHYGGTGRGYEARGHGAHHRARTSYRKRLEEEAGSDEDYNERQLFTPRRRYGDDDDDIVDGQPSGYYFNKYKDNSRKKLISHSSNVGESKARRSRYDTRKDWRYKFDDEEDEYAYLADDEDESEDSRGSRKQATRKSRIYQDKSKSESELPNWHSSVGKFDEWLKRTKVSANNSRINEFTKKRHSHAFNEDRDLEDARLDEEDDESELWKDEDEDKELDNDFYKNDEVASTSLKTYDDIIRRLTEDRTTTSTVRSTTPVKRNTDIESHLRRDVYGNIRFIESSKRNSSLQYRSVGSSRSSNLVDGTTSFNTKSRKDLVAAASKYNVGTKKKSLEEYEEVEEEDNAKAAGEDEAGTQADANMEYVDDENEDEDTSPAFTSTTSAPTSTSTTTPTTTTTTTTTQHAIVTDIRREHKELRSFEPRSTGSQYNGYQGKNDYPAMSEHSARKWHYLGTREGVRETRNNMSQFGRQGKSAEMSAAHNHAMRVSKEGSCQWPRDRVIPVRDLYPNTMATYIPHCAILHRCSDDTGCCKSETLTCEAKHIQRVELYFYVTYMNKKTEIEKLSFDNHTECECRERRDFGNDGRQMELRSAKHFSLTPPQNIVRSSTGKPCHCPPPFASKITVDGVCECTCIENDQHCLQLQRGKSYLSLTARTCIYKGICTTPKCTFGEFNVTQGKCPLKKDVFEDAKRRRANFDHRRRS